MTDPSSPIKPPLQAGPARRTFHTFVALAGWALFIYWWWIVFHRVDPHEVRFTVLFIAVSLVAVVIATSLWVGHNVRIFRRKGPRRRIRRTTADFSHDGVGRAVTFPTADSIRTAAIVYIREPNPDKRYETPGTIPPQAVRTPVPGVRVTPQRPRTTS